ncbi:putative Resolvase domain [Desulfosarcina cetonica]|uniref:recombinase family protein n=1 Tax=Desulfosarcina cetonica TaxID=90730 RepID=UPI0006CF2B95|nr:recombinase family protein [Desulfosarcina cetonica]VTR66876.1 putative Resolvase domain [Desulfosarcina cetonica]
MKNRLCGLYIRVSTLRQADVVDGSLDAQESILRSHVENKNNHPDESWEIAGVYREEGRSGKDLNRPEFQRIIRDINRKKINTIIVYKIDRLTRSLKDFSILWDELDKIGVKVVSIVEQFDTTTPIGRAMLHIVLVFAQLEREQTAERTAATMQYRAEQGLWNGGRILGYDLDPDDKGTLKVNGEQASVVRKAFELCIETGSAGKAQTSLNDLGYRVPVYESRRGKKHGGKLFNKQVVINMLQNPVYRGQITWNDNLYDGKHEPIIDEKTYTKVQEILARNRKTRSNRKMPSNHTYLLQGILTCGKCGSVMTPKSGIGRSSRYYYYQCTKNTHVGNEGCHAKYVPAEPIENFVVERVKELTTDSAEIDRMVEKANRDGDLKVKGLIDRKKALAGNLQEVKKKLGNIMDSIESGNLKAFDSLNRRIEALESEQAETETNLKKVDFEIDEIKKQTLSAEVMGQSFRTFRDILDKAKPQQLKELINRIVEVVEWHEDENDRASGHCRISYFEQPNLHLPIKKLSEPDGELRFAESMVWLPVCNPLHNHSLSLAVNRSPSISTGYQRSGLRR